MTHNRLVVCVPARNEEVRLPRLIKALAQQTLSNISVIVSLNNTTDRSSDVLHAARQRYPSLNLVVDQTTFAAETAHAGSARRRAMDIAADIAGAGGYILTTDADTRPPPEWLATNMAAITTDLDIVGGRIVLDESEPVDDKVAPAHRLADRYWARVRDLEDEIDPVPWDPAPRHGDHTGASLCVTVAAYRGCGGVPAIPTGEDRALVQAVVQRGGRLAHPVAIWTRVSPRIDGRAIGGMADHMLRLAENCRTNRPAMLPSFAQWQARAAWRRETRLRGGAALVAELEADLPAMIDDMILDDAVFELVV